MFSRKVNLILQSIFGNYIHLLPLDVRKRDSNLCPAIPRTVQLGRLTGETVQIWLARAPNIFED